MGYFDVNPSLHPEQFKQAVQRMTNHLVNATDDEVAEGIDWYSNVRSATKKQVPSLGIPLLEASGIVAAVSPNMDFEKNNINALDEIQNLDKSDWELIQASNINTKKNKKKNAQIKAAGGTDFVEAGRLPEVKSMLSEKAPSLSTAPDTNLVDAHRLLHGREAFADVLRRSTSPKRNAFGRNIFGDPNVITIDGRSSDMIADNMRGWTSDRGIQSADLKRGGTTRYEDNEQVIRAATTAGKGSSRLRAFGLQHPYQTQAITWVRGKNMELTGPDGERRGKGPKRQGQPYA